MATLNDFLRISARTGVIEMGENLIPIVDPISMEVRESHVVRLFCNRAFGHMDEEVMIDFYLGTAEKVKQFSEGMFKHYQCPVKRRAPVEELCYGVTFQGIYKKLSRYNEAYFPLQLPFDLNKTRIQTYAEIKSAANRMEPLVPKDPSLQRVQDSLNHLANSARDALDNAIHYEMIMNEFRYYDRLISRHFSIPASK